MISRDRGRNLHHHRLRRTFPVHHKYAAGLGFGRFGRYVFRLFQRHELHEMVAVVHCSDAVHSQHDRKRVNRFFRRERLAIAERDSGSGKRQGIKNGSTPQVGVNVKTCGEV